MDTKVVLSTDTKYVPDSHSKLRNIQPKHNPGYELNLSEMTEDSDVKTESSSTSSKFLSSVEMATLHVLFGSEKPGELTFYGRNEVDNIHRGQLIDITG